MNILGLPIEILEAIIKKIRNTQSYINLRMTCYDFYKLMEVIIGFHEDGSIKMILPFYKHIPVDRHLHYHINGIVRKIVTFNNRGKIHGDICEFFNDASVAYKGRYINGNKYGTHYKFYSSGQSNEVLNYLFNRLNGYCYSYYPDGTTKCIRKMSLGKINGPINYFWDTGLPKYSANFRYNILHGDIKLFHSNGEKFITGKYEYGIPQGYFRFYNMI